MTLKLDDQTINLAILEDQKQNQSMVHTVWNYPFPNVPQTTESLYQRFMSYDNAHIIWVALWTLYNI